MNWWWEKAEVLHFEKPSNQVGVLRRFMSYASQAQRLCMQQVGSMTCIEAIRVRMNDLPQGLE